jgi:CubicO group peptidase (beta-lactamase class C family)
MRAEYRNVTLRQLLGHIGGIAPNIENVALAGTGTLTVQRANLAKWATSVAATGGGVGTYNYSNVGYMVAANMVERAVGASWEDYQQAKLLAPLGITAFGWGPAPSNSNPVGHQRISNAWSEFPTSDNPPFLSAAGRSHWSLDAYTKVLQDIMKADQGQSALVPQAVARINTTSQSSANYASGWAINNAAWSGGRGVEHDGSNNLNYTRTQVSLERGVAVTATTNSHDTGSNRSNDAMVALTTRLWAYYEANSN